MRLAFGQVKTVDRELMMNTKQLAIDNVMFNLPYDLEAVEYWKLEDLQDFVDRCKEFDVNIEAMENLPISFYDKVMIGEEGLEKQIENVCTSIENLGKVGIPVLGMHFSPSFVWRTENEAPLGRHGSTVQAFDLEKQMQGIDDMADFGQRRDIKIPSKDILWENFEYFMGKIIPTAEKAGVKICIHPDDPPIESLSGIARLFTSVDDYKKAFEMVKSDNLGVLLCVGTFASMKGGIKNVYDAIDSFGKQGKIFYVHMRSVEGEIPKFHEVFMGQGTVDIYETLKRLNDSGFDGFIVSDHVPHIEGDTTWGHRVRYADTFYMKGIIDALGK